MKTFRVDFLKTTKHSATLTAKNEKDARDRFEKIRPENGRVIDVVEVDRSLADVDA